MLVSSGGPVSKSYPGYFSWLDPSSSVPSLAAASLDVDAFYVLSNLAGAYWRSHTYCSGIAGSYTHAAEDWGLVHKFLGRYLHTRNLIKTQVWLADYADDEQEDT